MLKQGTPLRYPIRDKNGVLLLAQGSLVNEHLRKILEVRGISLAIQAALTLVEGGQVGLEFPITKPIFKIGRRPECDLRLNSHVVSGHHCRITRTSFEVLLSDLNSSNGTYLNDRRVTEETELNDQDKIRIGRFTFKTQIGAALAADSSAGERALKAWVLEEVSPRPQPATLYGRTEPDIDLDNLPDPV